MFASVILSGETLDDLRFHTFLVAQGTLDRTRPEDRLPEMVFTILQHTAPPVRLYLRFRLNDLMGAGAIAGAKCSRRARNQQETSRDRDQCLYRAHERKSYTMEY